MSQPLVLSPHCVQLDELSGRTMKNPESELISKTNPLTTTAAHLQIQFSPISAGGLWDIDRGVKSIRNEQFIDIDP